jgi:hypothetical protein
MIRITLIPNSFVPVHVWTKDGPPRPIARIAATALAPGGWLVAEGRVTKYQHTISVTKINAPIHVFFESDIIFTSLRVDDGDF